MFARLKEMYKQRADLAANMRGILDRATKESRALTTEEDQEWSRMEADVTALDKDIDRLEKQRAIDKREEEFHAEERKQIDPANKTDEQKRDQIRHEAFIDALRYGIRELEPEKRATLQIDKSEGGGFLVASERFMMRLIQEVDDVLMLRGLATKFLVGYEESLGFPTLDSDLTAFEYGGAEIQDAVEDTGLGFGKRELKPKPMKRKTIKVSELLMMNNRVDIESIIRQRIMYALASGEESAFMTGTGSIDPLGMFTASDTGIGTARDQATTAATGFGSWTDLVDIQGKLNEAYNGTWLFHPDAVTKLRKLQDGIGLPIWQPSIQVGKPNTILGRPYITGDKVPNTFTAGLYIGMYGDFSYYWIADALGMQIQRLVEKYAESGQVGLLCKNIANDGMPILGEAFVRIKTAAG